MTIGLDIDDTITNSSELIMEYAKSYFKTDNIDEITEILNSKKIDGELFDFYNKHLAKMMEKYEIKDNAKEVIDRLREKGHKIIVITARGYTIKNGLIKVTKEYFYKHQLVVDKMIFKSKEKKESCIKNKVDIMIDDSISVLENFKESNIKTLLFTSKNNKKYKTNIDRVSNWIELEKYVDELSKPNK